MRIIEYGIANLKHATVPELQELLDNVSAAIRSGTLRGQDLADAEAYYDAIAAEIGRRPLPASLEQACGLEPKPEADLPETWPANALSEAERMIASYCQKHGMTYAEFRQKVDCWLERQDAKPQAAKLLPRMRRRLEHGMG